MNTDSHFLIGHSHYVCEDYALSGSIGDITYAIVSDGCSSTKDTDFGSRILTRCAADVIKIHAEMIFKIPQDDVHATGNLIYNLIGSAIIKNAQRIVRSLGMPDNVLDATLIMAINHDIVTKIFFYGDGVVSIRSGDSHDIFKVEFPSGAPYYLSYLLDPDRNADYIKTFGTEYNLFSYHDEIMYDGIMSGAQPLDILEEFPYITSHCLGGTISVLSDGINTFHNNQPIDFMKSLADITDFKNLHGSFVKRKMNALRRKYNKLDIIHDDDISMATIYLDE